MVRHPRIHQGQLYVRNPYVSTHNIKANQPQGKPSMNSDLLDAYCKNLFGHTNWSMDADDDGNVIIKFYAMPSEDDDNTNEGEQND